ncbi:MAG: transcription termination factor NusA [Dehalococcoidia bacterium]|nr:transcription termination factor NusA [Dehalococcoidia bacterium]
MKNEFVIAITQLSAEKNLDSDTVFAAVESAMASALKKDDLQWADVVVKINRDSGDIETFRRYEVMADDDIEDDEIQMSPERAAKMGFPGKQAGDEVLERLESTPNQGRIAAQTAKQVVLQRLREAERESVFEDFTGKEGELVSGTVLRVEGGRRQVILDLGRTEAVLPASEQIRAEHYRVGQRLRVFVKEVYKASKGPQVVVSRSNPALLRRLFELEIPEIARGVVEIMGISRDAGYRAKVAVVSRQHGIDPIGACVGVRGARIQNIINELGGERIDIIRWDPVEEAYVANALSPAEVVSIRLDRDENTAYIAVPDKQLSLAIGKEGQNARLAAKLTGRRIDIRPESALIQAGEDMYPPPEPNMEAIPVERAAAASAAVETAPERVAPSQAAYARPGLPGEHPKPEVAPAPVEEEEVRLTPEQEILAEIVEAEPEVEEAVAAEPEPPVRVERPRADRPAAGGLRFAEEIREVQRSEDEDEANRRDRRKRRGGTTPAGPARPARPPRGGTSGRRFDLDDIDEEEIEAALHGDDFLDDEDDDEGDDY